MRLFFASWPPASALPVLHHHTERLHRRLGGRPVPRARLHLTLAFLGEVDEARLAELMALAAELAAVSRPGLLRFDRAGGWANGIGWLAPGETPTELTALVAGLNAALAAAGFATERRRYRPHLTLLRATRHAERPQPIPSLVWPLDHLALVASTLDERGPSYRELARWPLEGAA